MKILIAIFIILIWIWHFFLLRKIFKGDKKFDYDVQKFNIEMSLIVISILFSVTVFLFNTISILDSNDFQVKQIKLIEEQNIILLDIKNSLNSNLLSE